MAFTTLIDPLTARQHLEDADWIFIDCRFAAASKDPARGFADYQAQHIRGAVYADLNIDLSGPVVPGKTGRHPLPHPDVLANTLTRFGIGPHSQVVVYDANSGHMAASRLWWLLKWVGHDSVAVLHGGFQAWVNAGYPCTGGVEARESGDFRPRIVSSMVADAEQVTCMLSDPSYLILDSRSPDRYRGENESLDPVAGHIPHAMNAPFLNTVGKDGTLKSPTELREHFAQFGSGFDAAHTVFYCGSGVTATLNILAFVHAGNSMPVLYPGSWSDWITDPSRPVAIGKYGGSSGP